MKKKTYKRLRKKLLALSEKWCKPIGLGWWRITLSYDRTGESFKDSESTENGYHSGVAARCFPDWRYSVATIVCNMPELARLDDEQLEYIFVHELMHIFLHEMREGANERKQLPHEERVATALAKAFIWHAEHLQSNVIQRESNNNGDDIEEVKISLVGGHQANAVGREGSNVRIQH